MKIKKLIINGFKSFGEKTEILFDENLIGIVGPNGSGKSNVIDSIRWVLGQQKASELRTKSNTDVIFSGSDDKSAKNVAEVTLVLDNEDKYLDIEYADVAITRRLYRTGENEYYINKNRCRLIDINNLILDKGFGKDSFSIISQGKVEEIIMSKPDKRREIIDEVAGISKYKYKKKITLNKLKIVNENIDRIDFILNEINNVIEPLRKEKEKAIRYKEIKGKVEIEEKNLFANKIYKNKENMDDLKYELDVTQKSLSQENKKIEDFESSVRSLEQSILDDQTDISTINEKINNKIHDKMLLENEIKLLEQKQELHGKNDKQKIMDSVRSQLESIKKEEQEILISRSILEPEIETVLNKISKIQEEYYLNQEHIYKLQREFEDAKNQDSTNKYPYHIKKVLDLNEPGVLGTVKEIINIYSKYEISINTILGNRRNEIIVENENIIPMIIKYLKDNKLGKITFSPINKVKPKFIDENTKRIIKEKNLNIVIANECVQYDKKYDKVISSLLGNVLIAEDIEYAQKVDKLLNGKYQIVTLDGNILFTSGKVLGGYEKKNKLLITKEKLESLEINIKEKENNKNEYSRVLDKLNLEKSEKQIKLELIKQKLIELTNNKNSLQNEYNLVVEDSQDIDSNNIKKIEENIVLMDKEIIELTQEKNQKESRIKSNIEIRDEKSQNVVGVRANYKVLIQKETEDSMKYKHYELETRELIEKLREKYNISFQKAYENSIKIDDIAEKEKELKKIKSEIKDLGFVNIKAIEEYEKQKERLDFYSTNKNDLVESKNKIEGVIAKIDEFVVSMFSETFYKLNEEFKIVFSQLFDGGSATLKLTEEEDMLNTGVEIIAKPPGKKSQIIGLLSGGEKAFTAVALLFSILKIRIVPFCILDEVEAALDEANVVKYIEYLRIFSQRTQFIIITHRQTTMEKIDKLYGITMIEKGVSSVLNINLKEEEKNV